MNNNKSSGKVFRKSQSQYNINVNKNAEIMKKITEEKKENKEIKPPVKQPPKTSSFSGGSGFFAKTPEVDIKNEPLGTYYEDRKKIIFRKIAINKDEYYISQFLLNSQKKILDEYKKMSSGSSFFFDVPKKVYNFALGLKENIANFCLIIKLYLLNDKKDKAFEIFLLMSKQNKKLIEFVYSKLSLYCKKASPQMLRFTPTISKMFIQILSCLIKLSGKFCKTTIQNIYTLIYLKTIYMLILREIHKINAFRNDIKTQRLYIYSNCLFDISIFIFNGYQPLSISTYILQHILELYEEKNFKDETKYEQILMLKINYNLGLLLYVDGKNNEAINYLMKAKEILSEIILYSYRNEERDYVSDIGRNSAILENQEKHLINKLIFFKDKNKNNNNNIDGQKTDLSNQFAKKNFSQNKVLVTIKEESNNSLIKRKSLYDKRSSGCLFLGLKTLESKKPLLYEHIKRRISFEIELLLSQIELKKNNYRGALDHINIILKREKIKDSCDIEITNKKKIFNNKTFKNLKSFQGLSIRKLSKASISQSKAEDNNKNKNNNIEKNNLDNNFNNEVSILKESDIQSISLLLEKIDHEYTENIQIQHSKSFFKNKRSKYYTFYKNKTKKMNYTNFKEMEKFFIFICNLSIFQLKILNETQPKLFTKRNDLPIIFSNQFQDCLTNAQRLELSNLQTMSLSRYIILIDSEKDISPENLDYKYMKYKIKSFINNNEEDIIKVMMEDKGKTINSRKSNDSGMNTISTNYINNNINIVSIKKNVKKEIEYEDESCMFDILLSKIKNEKNKDIIESHKKCILKTLNNLSSEDKKLFQNSPNLLKKMLRKIEIQIKKNNTIDSKNNINYSSDFKDCSNCSFLSSHSYY